MFHLDSGASTSILPITDADALGIKLNQSKKILVRGFAGESSVGYRSSISLKIGILRLATPVVFVDAFTQRILGREGVFPKFAIIFDELKQRTGFLDSKKNRAAVDAIFADSI